MTKFEARLAKSNWSKALAEGRVVRFNDGASFKAFKTSEDAKAFAAMLSHDDMSATVVLYWPADACTARARYDRVNENPSYRSAMTAAGRGHLVR